MYGSVLIMDGNGSRSDRSLRWGKLTAFLIRLCPVDNIAFSGWLNHLWKGFSYHKNTAPALWSRGCVFIWQHFGQYL